MTNLQPIPEEDPKRANQIKICLDAYSASERGDQQRLIEFTHGVLKLPPDYWTAVIEALADDHWRSARHPLAYVCKVAVTKKAAEAKQINKGALGAWELAPDKPGTLKILVKDGITLGSPEMTEPLTRSRRRRRRVPTLSGVVHSCRKASEGSADEDIIDGLTYRAEEYYETPCAMIRPNEQLQTENAFDSEEDREPDTASDTTFNWDEIGRRAGLDADETALLGSRAECEDDSEARTLLGWDYKRLDAVRNRLERKYPAVQKAIMSKA